jgi:hypothetical protein
MQITWKDVSNVITSSKVFVNHFFHFADHADDLSLQENRYVGEIK